MYNQENVAKLIKLAKDVGLTTGDFPCSEQELKDGYFSFVNTARKDTSVEAFIRFKLNK
jgi:hypothetical protein